MQLLTWKPHAWGKTNLYAHFVIVFCRIKEPLVVHICAWHTLGVEAQIGQGTQ